MPIKKKILLIAAAVLLLLFVLASVITVITMRRLFGRCSYPDRRISSAYWYDPDYKDTHPRENVQFTSGKNTLQGYIYGMENESPRALLVFAHGIYAGHESYINQLMWFVDQGYRVFAYDATGCCTSEGDGTRGLGQSPLDLDAALTFAESDARLSGLPVVLLGHSWGGFAVSAVQNFDHDVAAVCSLSAYAYPVEMLDVGAERTLGGISFLFHPFAWGYHHIMFGKYADFNAVDAINHSGIPNLIVHGENDDFVPYEKISVLSNQDKITNPNARFVTLTGEFAMHNEFFNSDAANAYIKAWNEEHEDDMEALLEKYGRADQIPVEERAVFFVDVDKQIVNDFNTDLLGQIDAFYREHLG